MRQWTTHHLLMAVERCKMQRCAFNLIIVVDITTTVKHQLQAVKMTADGSPADGIKTLVINIRQ